MTFFVGVRERDRTAYYNLDRARSVAHDQTSVDRARCVFEFSFFLRQTITVQRDSQAEAYNRISAYFSENSTGV